jgi:hypothetical protein
MWAAGYLSGWGRMVDTWAEDCRIVPADMPTPGAMNESLPPPSHHPSA